MTSRRSARWCSSRRGETQRQLHQNVWYAQSATIHEEPAGFRVRTSAVAPTDSREYNTWHGGDGGNCPACNRMALGASAPRRRCRRKRGESQWQPP